MSRRFLLAILVFVVVLYFSIILFMLNPLHSARGFAYSSFPYKRVPVVEWCKPLRWRIPPGEVVALASYPGSGNTWLRYLLQQATGILTGSIYMDHGLRLHGFPAENVSNGSVLVVKIHEAPPPDMFKAAVLLIRNPRDAILADFNRLYMGHIGTAPKSAFRKKAEEKGAKDKSYLIDWEDYVGVQIAFSICNANNVIKAEEKGVKDKFNKLDWEGYVYTRLAGWETRNRQWLSHPVPLHIMFYEALVKDTRRQLRSLLDFLNYNITEMDLTCAIANREGIYRRRKKHKDFDPFTPEMYRALETVKNRVLKLVHDHSKHNHNQTVGPKL